MTDRVVIAGGGICGLASALALSRKNCPVTLLEQRSAFSEEGAGLQLGPNAVRVLHRLGVAPQLKDDIAAPSTLTIYDGRSGKIVQSLPLQSWCQERFSLPYWTVHRQDLQESLVRALSDCPNVDVELGFKLSSFEQVGSQLTVYEEGGRRVTGSALIGADGLWSRVRELLFDDGRPQFTGYTAWRALADGEAGNANMGIGLWLGRNAHLVHYPIRNGRQINLVAVTQDDWRTERWSTQSDPALLIEKFKHWPDGVNNLLARSKDWRRWSLYSRPFRSQWSDGAVTLAGDAAHPILPFLAQGAALGLEDGEDLAQCMEQANNDFAAAWRAFEERRAARAKKVMAHSAQNGRVYHLPGLAASMRNLVVRSIPTKRLLGRFGWLYGYGL